MVEFIQGHLKEIGLAIVALFVASRAMSWLRHRQSSHRGLNVYCKHCNWEGRVQKATWSCRKCGSKDLTPA